MRLHLSKITTKRLQLDLNTLVEQSKDFGKVFRGLQIHREKAKRKRLHDLQKMSNEFTKYMRKKSFRR